jgi:hypothetical protein
MAIKYCDYVSGNDSTGDGTYSSPYKTIPKAVTGLTGGDSVRCAKTSDPVDLTGNLTWTYNSRVVTTASDLTGTIDPKKAGQVILANLNGADAATTYTAETGQIATFYGNAKLSTTDPKLGSASAYFDGSGDYISFPQHIDQAMNQYDFTIDFWAKVTTPGTTQSFCAAYQDGNNYWTVYLSSNKVSFQYYVGAVWKCNYATTNNAIVDSNWHRITVVRNGAAFYIFIDGVSQTLTTNTAVSTNSLSQFTSPIYLGCLSAGGSSYGGYIDAFRYHIGQSVYTANFDPAETEPATGTGYFIGKGTDEYWYQVIGSYATQLNLRRKYAGTSGTTTGKMLQWTDTGDSINTTNVIQTLLVGTNGTNDLNRIDISGGWDLSTQTQTGWTNFYQSGVKGMGKLLYYTGSSSDSINGNYLSFSKFRCARYNNGFQVRNGGLINYTDLTFLECSVGWGIDRYFAQYCVFTRMYSIGCYNYGMYASTSTSGNFWEDCVFASNYYGNYFDGTGFSSNNIVGNKYNCNDYMALYMVANSQSQTNFMNCEFNNNSYGYYSNGGTTYHNFSNCQFCGNTTTGCYIVSETVWFTGCKFNNNGSGGYGLYMNQCSGMFDGCEFKDNINEGLYWNFNSTSRFFQFRNCVASGNQVGRDFYFHTNVYSPGNAQSYLTCPFPNRYYDEGYSWLVENTSVGVWRVDFHPSYGPGSNYQMHTLGTNWLWSFVGVVGKYTGTEARGGSGDCMYLQPFSRYTNYYDQLGIATKHKKWQAPLSGRINFRVDNVASDKRLTVYVKKTADFTLGEIYLAVPVNNRIVYAYALDVTTDYKAFTIDLDKDELTAGAFYTLMVCACARNDVWNAGKVYVDDFSVADI